MSFYTDDVTQRLHDGARTADIASMVGCEIADVVRIARSAGYSVNTSGVIQKNGVSSPDYGRAHTERIVPAHVPAATAPAATVLDERVSLIGVEPEDALKAMLATPPLADIPADQNGGATTSDIPANVIPEDVTPADHTESEELPQDSSDEFGADVGIDCECNDEQWCAEHAPDDEPDDDSEDVAARISDLVNHEDKRIRQAANALIAVVAEYEENGEARAEVERLERELAEAKAKLRGSVKTQAQGNGRHVTPTGATMAEMRTWLREHGHAPNGTGHLRREFVEIYARAHAT